MAVKSLFNKIEPSKKKSVKVAEQIIDLVESGDLGPGDRLPSEHELAEKMEVSRPSVREALSGLQALEVVDTKIGSGTYVSKSVRESNIISTDLSLLEREISHLHIIEARKNLEDAMLDMIVDNIDQKETTSAEAALNQMKNHSTEKEYRQYMDADHDFHEALVGLTDNPLVEKAARPLIATIDGSLYRELTHKYYLVDDSRIKSCFKIHKDLFDSINRSDIEDARTIMERHWALMEEALEKSEN